MNKGARVSKEKRRPKWRGCEKINKPKRADNERQRRGETCK